MKKLTTKEFIEKSIFSHGDKYDYSKSHYVNKGTKINIVCKTHGEFEIHPENHYRSKQGCKKCALQAHKLENISEEKLNEFKKIHGDKYIYEDLTVTKGRINIICSIHGLFNQSIYNHGYGHGCKKCALEARKKPIPKSFRTCKTCKERKELEFYNPYKLVCIECTENPPIIDLKKCRDCEETKSISEFELRDKKINTYRNSCTVCYKLKTSISKRLYRQKNKVILGQKEIARRKKKMETDPVYQAKVYARNLIRKSFYKKGYSKSSQTFEILGCSYEEFKEHIESQFQENMNWENRKLWHIDHIVPLRIAISEEEVIHLNHYTNLRPLWEDDNLRKGDIVNEENELYQTIMYNR